MICTLIKRVIIHKRIYVYNYVISAIGSIFFFFLVSSASSIFNYKTLYLLLYQLGIPILSLDLAPGAMAKNVIEVHSHCFFVNKTFNLFFQVCWKNSHQCFGGKSILGTFLVIP